MAHDYIREISLLSDHYGNLLLRLMDRYRASNLKDITQDQARDFLREYHQERLDNMPRVDRCVCCDEIIPEGRQVCPVCESTGKIELSPSMTEKSDKSDCSAVI